MGNNCHSQYLSKSYRSPDFVKKRLESLSLLCEDSGKLLLHASGVIRRGRLWLFCGPSCSGKTTIATELNAGGDPFSLDMVVISCGEDGRIAADSTPLSDDRGVAAPRSQYSVFGIALIEQSPKDEIFCLSAHQIATKLMAESVWFSKSTEGIGRLMEIVGRIVESTRCVGLRFTKSESFWALLDEIEAK
jgi:hypothetical protein